MNKFYYFHGFNSAIPREWYNQAKDSKLRTLSKWCRKNGYTFQPENIDYKKPAFHIRDLLYRMKDEELTIVSGCSLGGWFARIMQLKLVEQNPEKNVMALAFNPSVNPGESLLKARGWLENYKTKEQYAWTHIDCEELTDLQESVDYEETGEKFFVFLDSGDEQICPVYSSTYYAKFTPVTTFEGGSHSFEHTKEALSCIDPLVQLTK